MSRSFQRWVNIQQLHIEQVLEGILAKNAPDTLPAAMRYAVLGGGKRLRPMLTFAAGELFNATNFNCLSKVAAAVELIHAYSLVHDDLPVMDNDLLRRGKPSCHAKYGPANAILAGDALQALAFEILSAPGLCPDAHKQLRLIQLLSYASGREGMCGGQVLDLEATGQNISLSALEKLHRMKTGALIHAAILMGALCADDIKEEALAQLSHFAKCMGFAFQIIDDVLDAEENSTTLGKTSGKDECYQKSTFVSLLGLAEAKKRAGALHQQACSYLTSFGNQAMHLYELANFIIERRH